MHNQFTVRAAGTSDIGDAAVLFDAYRVFYGRPSDANLAREFISGRLRASESTVLLARDATGRPVGFAQLYPSFSSISCRRTLILNDLYTVADMRARGVGRALLEAVRSHALSINAAYVSLETAIDNTLAQALYESFGFIRDASFCTYALDLRVATPPA